MEFNLLPMLGAVSVALIMFIAWGVLMYYFAGKDNKWGYWIVFLLGLSVPVTNGVMWVLKAVSFIDLIIGIITLLFIALIGATLYEQGGNKQWKWYIITILFSPLAIVYQIVKK